MIGDGDVDASIAFFVTLIAFTSVAANVFFYLNTKWYADKATEAHDKLARTIINRRRM